MQKGLCLLTFLYSSRIAYTALLWLCPFQMRNMLIWFWLINSLRNLFQLSCLQDWNLPYFRIRTFFPFKFLNGCPNRHRHCKEAQWAAGCTSLEMSTLSWDNEVLCVVFGALGFIKVISKAFKIKVLPAFPGMHGEDGSVIILTFLSEVVFEPLDDSDKCHCCHLLLSFNYIWLSLSTAPSRKLN